MTATQLLTSAGHPRQRRSWYGGVAALVIAMVAFYGVATMTETANADHDNGDPSTPVSGGGIVPTYVAGADNTGKTCAEVAPGTTEYRLEEELGNLENGTHTDGTISVTITNLNDDTFDWSSNLLVEAVVVKGGEAGSNLYDYPSPGAASDTGLGVPHPENNGISHINFCYDPNQEPPETTLTVTKDATATYDRTCEWDVVKAADDTTHESSLGGTVDVNYTVTFSVECEDSNFLVSGNITVANTGLVDASVNSVTDDVNGTAATVSCLLNGAGDPVAYPITLTPGDELNCTYSALLAGAINGNNVATANADAQDPADPAIDFDSNSVPFTFVQNPTVDGCVDIADTWPETTVTGTLCEEDAPFDPFLYTVTFGPFTEEDCGPNQYQNTASFETNTTKTTDSSSVTVVITVDCGEWCSPGYWRNHIEEAEAAAAAGSFSLDDKYSAHFPALSISKKAQKDGAEPDPTLRQVLESPQYYGGEAFNNVGDLLSEAHPDVDFQDIRIEDSCPLN